LQAALNPVQRERRPILQNCETEIPYESVQARLWFLRKSNEAKKQAQSRITWRFGHRGPPLEPWLGRAASYSWAANVTKRGQFVEPHALTGGRAFEHAKIASTVKPQAVKVNFHDNEGKSAKDQPKVRQDWSIVLCIRLKAANLLQKLAADLKGWVRTTLQYQLKEALDRIAAR
jgi:hypothetical protein